MLGDEVFILPHILQVYLENLERNHKKVQPQEKVLGLPF